MKQKKAPLTKQTLIGLRFENEQSINPDDLARVMISARAYFNSTDGQLLLAGLDKMKPAIDDKRDLTFQLGIREGWDFCLRKIVSLCYDDIQKFTAPNDPDNLDEEI